MVTKFNHLMNNRYIHDKNKLIKKRQKYLHKYNIYDIIPSSISIINSKKNFDISKNWKTEINLMIFIQECGYTNFLKSIDVNYANFKDECGNNPLTYIYFNNFEPNYNLVKLLIKGKSLLYHKDIYGKCFFDYVKDKEYYPKVVKLIGKRYKLITLCVNFIKNNNKLFDISMLNKDIRKFFHVKTMIYDKPKYNFSNLFY